MARALAVQPVDHAAETDAAKTKDAAEEKTLPPGAETIATSTLSIGEVTPSPDGKSVAFVTEPVHHRMEGPSLYEIFLVSATGGEVRQITHNDAVESGLIWSPDSRWLHFSVQAAAGSLEGKYRDVEGRLYRLDPTNGKVERLGTAFDGSFSQFVLLPDGREIALGLQGEGQQVYLIESDKATKLPGLAGSYAGLSAARNSTSILLQHSTISLPAQVDLAADPRSEERR